MTASLLPLPDDQRFTDLIEAWDSGVYELLAMKYALPPRSRWLRAFEDNLRDFYPQASSRDLSLTARHYFPGFLAAGHDVP